MPCAMLFTLTLYTLSRPDARMRHRLPDTSRPVAQRTRPSQCNPMSQGITARSRQIAST